MPVVEEKMRWIKEIVDDGEDFMGRPVLCERNICPKCGHSTWLEPSECPECKTRLEG
jgi:predicted Zn-ribbon and HTH transcriptional regulator